MAGSKPAALPLGDSPTRVLKVTLRLETMMAMAELACDTSVLAECRALSSRLNDVVYGGYGGT